MRKDFTIGGYIFYAACEAIRRGNVLLLSELEPEEIKDMGVISYNSLEELMRHVDVENKEICVIPYGGSVLPQLHETYDELIKDIK